MDFRNDIEETNSVESASVEEDRKESASQEVTGVGAGEYAGEAPLTSSSQWPGLEENRARELDVLLRSMHSLSKQTGFAPSRRDFYSATLLSTALHKKFFRTFSEFVHRCGYRTAHEMQCIATREKNLSLPVNNGGRAEEVTTIVNQVESGADETKGERAAKKMCRGTGQSVFGERLTGCDMLHAPTNELGVVMLFGMMAKELGFVIELVRPGYPDCEAKRREGNGRWRRVLIEFEFESNRFDHDPAGCDLIVCWRDNARKSEVEVLELKEEMEKRGLVLGGGK